MSEHVQNCASEKEARAKRYSRIKLQLSIFNIFLSLFILIFLTFSGASILFREWASSVSLNPFSIVFFYFLIFYVFSVIIDFPLSLYSSFILEHRYNLSNQTFGAWCIEDAKKKVLSFLLGSLLVQVLYMCMRFDSEKWWIWFWALWIFLSIVLNKLIPVFIVPLFYKYTEIADGVLKERIYALVQGTKLKVKNIYSINLSKTTKKANAAFMGLGKTKRVVLSDTLIQNFTHDEIEVVFAHELGHFIFGHIVKNILITIVSSFLGFFIAQYVLSLMLTTLNFYGVSDVATFPLMCLIFSILGLIVMPLQNSYSRMLERQADTYALERTNKKDAFISTMMKLAEINLSDSSPHPVIEFIFYSHPALKKRILMAERFKRSTAE